MTVGERIQTYRKQLNMSQEELGQKLLVSRQTISLWEKDQTVPTVDNLLRLREIFNVSIDSILGIENKENISETEANEIYRFNYTQTELKEIARFQRKGIYKSAAVFTAICVYLIFVLFAVSESNAMVVFAFGIILIGLFFYIKRILTYKKLCQKNLQTVYESTYEYKIFENYIEINIYRKNERICKSKCYYTDIEKIYQLGKWLFFQFGGQTFIVRKSDLKKNSAFFSYMYNNPSKAIGKSISNKWSAISVILFIASVLSIFAALILVAKVSGVNKLFTENMWLFFLFTPIPISSIMFGCTLKSKGYKYKKNVIVGIIMTVLLCIYGSFTFIFANVYDHSNAPIIRAEQMTNIEIPSYKQINTQDWTNGTQYSSRGYIYSTSNFYFDKPEAEKFEKKIANDKRWLSHIQNDLIGITSPFSDYNNYDYMLIYNIDTLEYNTLPCNSGTYRFINILYKTKDNEMKIVEYDIDYVK